MFEIEPRSNLRPLIMAVLVGLLSLASNHYRRLDIKTLDSMLTSLATPRETETQPVSVFGMNPELRALQEKLPQVDQRISEAYARWQRGTIAIGDPELSAAVADARPFAAQLRSIVKQFSLDAQIRVLRILFTAEELQRGQFTASFHQLCTHLESLDAEKTRSTAGVLRFLNQHRPAQSEPSTLLPALVEFTQRYKDPECGVKLYAIVAHMLWSRGHLDDSQQILRRGIQAYTGTAGVSRLVNQMVDQQTAKNPGF